MNSYPAQLSAALARLADLLGGHLVAVGAVFVLLLLLMIAASRRGDVAQRGDDAASAPHRVIPPSQTPSTSTSTSTLPTPSPLADAEPVPVDSLRAILVVDDSAVARAKLRRLFETAGYRVELARDGLEALQLLPTAHFSVLVTDLEMPNMDGPELIATVVGSIETEDLPIVAITGHDELQARVHQVQGLYGIFRKPWNDRELLRRVEALASLRAPAGTQPSEVLARSA